MTFEDSSVLYIKLPVLFIVLVTVIKYMTKAT